MLMKIRRVGNIIDLGGRNCWIVEVEGEGEEGGGGRARCG